MSDKEPVQQVEVTPGQKAEEALDQAKVALQRFAFAEAERLSLEASKLIREEWIRQNYW